jgi:D-glycero-alpha-D-manno-heptose-7-phosphate kinase
LAGGTLDLWPLYLFHSPAVTVNVAINVLTTCRIKPLPGKQIRLKSIDTNKEEVFASLDELCGARAFRHPLAGRLVQYFLPECGFALETHSESPAGAGIAGSSALMIATTSALARFAGRRLSKEETRVLAQNVEAQLISVPTGCQDYYPALYGGASAIQLNPGGVKRDAIPVPPDQIDSHFLLAYTGAPRQSGINNWEVFKAHINGDKRVFRNFEQIARIACAMHTALSRADWNEVARLLRDEWKLRKTNAPGITTPLIEKLIAAAARNGGRAAKVCGAGGGGCVLFLVHPEAKQRVADAIRNSGGQLLPFQVAREGLRLSILRAKSTTKEAPARAHRAAAQA